MVEVHCTEPVNLQLVEEQVVMVMAVVVHVELSIVQAEVEEVHYTELSDLQMSLVVVVVVVVVQKVMQQTKFLN